MSGRQKAGLERVWAESRRESQTERERDRETEINKDRETETARDWDRWTEIEREREEYTHTHTHTHTMRDDFPLPGFPTNPRRPEWVEASLLTHCLTRAFLPTNCPCRFSTKAWCSRRMWVFSSRIASCGQGETDEQINFGTESPGTTLLVLQLSLSLSNIPS